MEELTIKTKAVELGEHEGEVTVAVNCLNVLDHQNDISATGSFTKTLKENFPNIRHYLNHDSNTLIGCPIEGKEENGELVFKSALCLDIEKAREIYALYKLYAKYGNTLQHSIGVTPIKRSRKDRRIVEEWKMHEFSTLTKQGACPGTHLIDIKSMGVDDDPDRVVSILKAAIALGVGERTKEICEDQIVLIEKAVAGDAVLVTCPECGLVFDWNSLEKHNIEDELKRQYIDELRWMAGEAVRSAAYEQREDIRNEVRNLIGMRKALEDIEEYVVCPKCYHRIYKSEIIDFGTSRKRVVVPVTEPAKATLTTKAGQEATSEGTDAAEYIRNRYSQK